MFPNSPRALRAAPMLVVFLALVAPPAWGKAPAEEGLTRALLAPTFRGAQVGILVARVEDGAPVFSRAPARALIPASNQKILTALAALDAFGPAHRFRTGILADREPDAAGAVGTLYVRGGGDPSLTSESLWRLAADLHRLGLRQVEGDVVLDAGVFDAVHHNASWAPITARAYHGPVAGLMANYSAFSVTARAVGGAGTPLRYAVDPPLDFFRVESTAKVGTRRQGNSLGVERARASNGLTVRVTGRLPAGTDADVVHRSVADPVHYFGAVLAAQLEAVGIAVAGRVREGATPTSAVGLHQFEGKDMAEVVRLFMKYSSNPIAEALIKQLGVKEAGLPGSWPKGIAALERRLGALGVELAGAQLVDGSGLSTGNRVAPQTFVSALRAARRSSLYGPEFVSALPIGATDGTLRKRARDAGSAVRGKTGFLTGAIGLSGFVRTRAGGDLVFSMLVNRYRGGDRETMRAVDRFVAELAGSELR